MNGSLKKTKIVATLGPSCQTKTRIHQLIKNGVNVFRINFSHAKKEEVLNYVKTIKSLNKTYDYNTAILADLQGPKIRIGELEEDIKLKKGDEIFFETSKYFVGNKNRIFVNYKNFAKDVKTEDNVLVDDGKYHFKVLKTDKKDKIKLQALNDVNLKSRKGVNLPNTKISTPSLTQKDIKDVKFAISFDVDWIALSFVRHEKDLIALKNLIDKLSKASLSKAKIPIIAKIEKPEALDNIDNIVKNSDGLMVARGDLGIEIPSQEVPLIQKKLVNLSKKARIPVIIATQMMESMIESSTPTRAEVNDVANSVMDGADAVMLSAETSIGNYPCETVTQISNIINSVEYSDHITVPAEPPTMKTERYITKFICFHAAKTANEINAAAITTMTHSGYTGFQISSWRPHSNILVFTSNKRILCRLSLLWGVKAFYYNKNASTDKTIEHINKVVVNNRFAKKGDMVINLAAMPVRKKGMVNTLRITEIS
ncbi:MAG TPA: pyruvate kinase [Flavobacteriaceae bacterium]|nr:pyruvate kinase [Flavobacteriaceae bacterium]